MSDNIFLDTNILVYTYSVAEPGKQELARKLVANNRNYISTQVLQELANVLLKKFKKNWLEISKVLDEVTNNCLLHSNSKTTIMQACEIAGRLGFSFYDGLIIAAALDCNCTILYSEDLNHNQIIDGKLKIINLFHKIYVTILR